MIRSGRYGQGTRTFRAPEWFRPILLGLFVAGIIATLDAGCFLIAHNLVVLPRQYDRLSAHGIPIRARVVDCHMASGKVCDLAYAYAGTVRNMIYSQDGDQFAAAGSTVTLLVDPSDPSVAFTDKDVSTGYQDRSELPLGLMFLSVSAVMVVALTYTVMRSASASGARNRLGLW